jgi:carbon storage regulator
MLVLTRKADQSIMIGDDIEIVVSSVEGNAVRIGIKAPRDLKILRKETFEEVRQENLRAVQAASQYTGGINKMLPRNPGKKNQKADTQSEEIKSGEVEK